MRSTHRVVRVAVAATLLGVLLAPALASAQEEGTETTTTVAVDDGGAAVPLPVPDVDEKSPPWTARYLPPTLVLLTVLIIGAAVLYYFVRIRGRYEVVAE